MDTTSERFRSSFANLVAFLTLLQLKKHLTLRSLFTMRPKQPLLIEAQILGQMQEP
jgi:hypothetical protein